MPAPKDNLNAMTNGVSRSRRAAAKGLRPRRLPKGFKYVANEASDYATALTSEVKAAHGTVSREHLESIQAAAAWHLHGLYVLRVLRVDHDQLKPDQRVQLSGEVAKAVQKRVDQVKHLNLSGNPHDPWTTITHHSPAEASTRDVVSETPETSMSHSNDD